MQRKKFLSKIMVLSVSVVMTITMMPAITFAAGNSIEASKTSMTGSSYNKLLEMNEEPYCHYHNIYFKKKMTLEGVKIKDSTGSLIKKPIKFKFWNMVLQKYEKTVTSKDGVLPRVELTAGQKYMVSSLDSTYDFKGPTYNAYVELSDDNEVNKRNLPDFQMMKKSDKTYPKEKNGRINIKNRIMCFGPMSSFRTG